MTAQTTIKKLPLIKEDVGSLKLRIQDLEKEVSNYKNRLDELRKAKNNLIIKKTTEYIKSEQPALGVRRESIPKVESPQENESKKFIEDNSEYVAELLKNIENLTKELSESKNLVAALRIENDENKASFEKSKGEFQVQLAEAYAKNEEYKREVKQWEVMYKEWMTMMEDRVTNINRTHQILQQCINQPTNQNN